MTHFQYDAFAHLYKDGGEFNEFYERPAVRALLGDVRGLRVLEAGCGSGLLAQWLVAQGADVLGCDASEAMLTRARERLGEDVTLWQQDLVEPLDQIASETLDVVVSSLVLHYLQDWDGVLDEFFRCLRPGGRLIVSVHHPFMDYQFYDRPDYFARELLEDQWGRGENKYTVKFWRRPLNEVFAAFVRAGFVVTQLAEPQPAEELREVDRKDWEQLTTQPMFLFVVAERPTASRG